jgi:membrane protease YdiL (CAAX protease family)
MPAIPPETETDEQPRAGGPRPAPGAEQRDAGPGRAGARPGPSLWIAPAAVVLGLLAGVFATFVIEIAGTAFGSPLARPSAGVSLVADVAFDLCFVLAALYLSTLSGRMGRAEFGYVRPKLRRALVAFLVAALGYYLLSDVYATLFALHGTDRLPSELGSSRSTAVLAGSAVFVCVIAPMAEEFFFRGFLFGVLRRMPLRIGTHELGPWVAALIVAVLFGLAHTGSASSQYLIPLGFLGFVLCLLRWRTGSLYPCMALHCLNNCLALGINQLGWNAGEIALLSVGSLAVIAMLTLPLSRGATGAPAAYSV